MSIIKLLPENLINQIAAGEVVERPASVVKELIENSLDAGSKKIIVEVLEGGKKLVKITDDGKGIGHEDLEMAIQRHATSKIKEEADLWNLNTMGFRGEALASIASVSKMMIASRQVNENSGIQLYAEGGMPVRKNPFGMHIGTIIEVQELFYNTPVRQKYLKKDATEISLISAVIQSAALSNPGVSFVFNHNGKKVMDFPAVSELSARICDIFGRATFDAMLPVFYGGVEMKIEGFVGKPLLARSSSKHQYLLVNKRPVQHYLVNHAITRAFHSMLMEHKKPVFVINITIDPSLIDVNVHPRKVEIRFEDEQNLVRAVYNMVKHALENSLLIPKGYSESQRYMSDKLPEEEVKENSAQLFKYSEKKESKNFSFEKNSSLDAKEFTKEIGKLREHSFGFDLKEEIEEIKVLSQVANSYIVAQKNQEVVLIDQHAAHERVRFELLMDQFESQEKRIQNMLVPQSIELSTDDRKIMEENMEVFENLGFDIEHFGGESYVINGIPVFFGKENIDEIIKGVLDDIQNGKEIGNIQGQTEKILTYLSCRSAIKFGQKLDLIEMQELVNQLSELKRPFTCPHGRPTMVSLNMDELGRMFGRK